MEALLEFRAISVSDCGEFEVMCLGVETLPVQVRESQYMCRALANPTLKVLFAMHKTLVSA